MGAMLGTSLYSCPYLKLAKMLFLSYCLLCFLFNEIREQEGSTGSAQKQGYVGGGAEGETGGSMYIHVSKCKNDKIKIN
jgi:hypothetical protein